MVIFENPCELKKVSTCDHKMKFYMGKFLTWAWTMMIVVIIIIMIMMITKSSKFGHLCVDLWEDVAVLISDMSGEHHVARGQRPDVHLVIDNKKSPWETHFTSCKANIPGNFWRMNCLRRVTSTFPGIVWSRIRQEALRRNCHFKRRCGRFSQYTWQEAHRSRWGWLCRAWTWLGRCSCCIQLQSSEIYVIVNDMQNLANWIFASLE